ncbi:MAG: HVO_0758 family zinc finger protein [Halanaeroarchaeum sp.]
MESVRKGLRNGDLERDTYDRLVCSECETSLKRRDDPDAVGTVRYCPNCGAEFEQIR